MTERVLLLDVMGTLVSDPFFVEMPTFFGLTFEEMLKRKEPTAWLEFERDEIDEHTFLTRFFVDHAPFDHAAFMAAVQSGYRLLPGIEALLQDLRRNGVTMHAFSNYPRWYERVEMRTQLSRYLDWTFVSCLTSLRKPAPAAYQHAIERLGVPAARCVFVDDREDNCRAARTQGMHAIRFTDAAALRTALAELGLVANTGE